MIKFSTFSIEKNEMLFGPGCRLVIWVQGCTLRCDGCTSPHLWDCNGGNDISEDALVELCSNNGVDGITFHGGEPMQQSDSLLKVAIQLLARGIDIVCFTGYEMDELESYSQSALASICDVLITGRYIREQRNVYLQYRGSTNQRVLFPSGKYEGTILKEGYNVSTIRMSGDAKLTYTGFVDSEVECMLASLAKIDG